MLTTYGEYWVQYTAFFLREKDRRITPKTPLTVFEPVIYTTTLLQFESIIIYYICNLAQLYELKKDPDHTSPVRKYIINTTSSSSYLCVSGREGGECNIVLEAESEWGYVCIVRGSKH